MPLCNNQITVRTENSRHTSGECCKGVPHQTQTRRIMPALAMRDVLIRTGHPSMSYVPVTFLPFRIVTTKNNKTKKKAVLRGKGEKLERPFLISIDKAMSLKGGFGFIRLDPFL
jgi:hypothetical protein